ncbi:peptidoglycan editing factor PgeF [Natribacillus halophilus]|uniref:Purine nucleoside phosphorylase n=1 Tax=Natribacillus halophilus TaxID=549003 RepID=A0A1G8MFP2_9BACI|nr:peptidoglycan editing factor PgeF [Natribacillus halophilus]SDI66627.1 conserved hypothetical protein [Natribacillus halophilus]
MKNEPFALCEQRTHLKLQTQEHVQAGFTTRLGGESAPPYNEANYGLHVGDDEEKVLANRERLADRLNLPLTRTVFAEQVHGNAVTKVAENDGGRGAHSLHTVIPGTDGLYTSTKNLYLLTLFADCVPLYFFDRRQTLVGIAHAGWQGTAANIGAEMVRRWVEVEYVSAEDIEVIIGPSIGPETYEVDEKVVSALDKVLPSGKKPWKQTVTDRYTVDLKEANALLLERAGIRRESMAISNACTYTNQELFFSHRRAGGKTGRMLGYIGLNRE